VLDFEAEAEQILAGRPGKLAFRALCATLARTGDPEELVARYDERLSSWPDEERQAPWSWLAALDAGYPKPTWPLVRSMTLRSGRCGTIDPALPDPRSHPGLRGVTQLDLGWYAQENLAALVETMDHWEKLRAIQIAGVTDMDEELLARLAGKAALARLEALNLVSVDEDMWHFQKPPFRPPAGRPWRLRHAGLRAPDLVHLMRSELVPQLRSAEVLVCSTEEALDLAGCAQLARLDRLAIGFRCGRNGRSPLVGLHFGNVIDEDDAACDAFFGRADLAGLRSLSVRGIRMSHSREGLGGRGTDAIVASGVLRRLTELTLHLLPIGDAAIARVVENIDHDHIESLALVDLAATDRTAAAFVAAGTFPRLRRLDLSGNHLAEPGARRLATEVQLPALEYLDLSGRSDGSPYYWRLNVQPAGDGGAQAWAGSPNAAKLTQLNLAATGLGTDGLIAVLNSERLRVLTNLDLSYNPLGDWPAVLRDAPAWRSLERLNLNECGLGDDAIEALTATSSAGCLRSVSLAYNSAGSRGARALASWPVLPRLWELELHDNNIGDDGLVELAGSRAAARLLELDLERDCWNSTVRYGTRLPDEVIDPASFPHLDAMFLGVVDEYHGARYSSGYPSRVRDGILSARTARPELVAFLAHVDVHEPDDPEPDPRWEAERADYDFRTGRAAAHAEYLQQVRVFAHGLIEDGG
jgi:hypothetical protein